MNTISTKPAARNPAESTVVAKLAPAHAQLRAVVTPAEFEIEAAERLVLRDDIMQFGGAGSLGALASAAVGGSNGLGYVAEDALRSAAVDLAMFRAVLEAEAENGAFNSEITDRFLMNLEHRMEAAAELSRRYRRACAAKTGA